MVKWLNVTPLISLFGCLVEDESEVESEGEVTMLRWSCSNIHSFTASTSHPPPPPTPSHHIPCLHANPHSHGVHAHVRVHGRLTARSPATSSSSHAVESWRVHGESKHWDEHEDEQDDSIP
jgi:hypothetical protein